MNETYFPPLTHIYLLIMNLFTLAGIAPTDRACSHAMENRGPSVLFVVSAALSLSLPLLAPLCVGETPKSLVQPMCVWCTGVCSHFYLNMYHWTRAPPHERDIPSCPFSAAVMSLFSR